MSGYEELRRRIADYLTGQFIGDDVHRYPEDECLREADFILAEVFHTLETVTPEMDDTGYSKMGYDDRASEVFLTMLRASPLAKPKEDAP